MRYPAYWADLTWTDNWTPLPLLPGPATAPSAFGAMGPNRHRRFFHGGGYRTAYVPLHHPVFAAIQQYLTLNLHVAHKAAPRGEATRMAHARDRMNDVHRQPGPRTHAETQLDQLRTTNLQNTLNETAGRFSGRRFAPPQPAQVQIVAIKAIKNYRLWNQFAVNKNQVLASLNANNLSPFRRVEWTVTDPTYGLPILDARIGEALLLHGTSDDIMQLVARGGFRPDMGRNKNACATCNGRGQDPCAACLGTGQQAGVACAPCGGTGQVGCVACAGTGTTPGRHAMYGALGQGTYLSDNFGKTMTYTVCPHCYAFNCACVNPATGARFTREVMLVRTVLGRPHSVRTQLYGTQKLFESNNANAPRRQSHQNIKANRHSVYGKKRGLYWGERPSLFGANEFLIKDASQMYPEFVVSWHW